MARKPQHTDLDGMTRIERLTWQLREAHADLLEIRASPQGTTARSTMHRTIAELGTALDDARAAAEKSGEVEGKDVGPEELRAAVAAASDAEFAVLCEAVEARKAGQRLRVVR